MENRLKGVIEGNRKMLSKLKITIDEIKNSGLDFVENAEQVDLFSVIAFTRITLFESYRLYIQILNIETEETIYFFDDVLENEKELEGFIMQAIKRMYFKLCLDIRIFVIFGKGGTCIEQI